MVLVATVADPPHPNKKNRHSSREMSFSSLVTRGRRKEMVVMPSECVAEVISRFCSSSTGGCARAKAYLRGREEGREGERERERERVCVCVCVCVCERESAYVCVSVSVRLL